MSVYLACCKCQNEYLVTGSDPRMSDSVLDELVRAKGWQVDDGGLNAVCPQCQNGGNYRLEKTADLYAKDLPRDATGLIPYFMWLNNKLADKSAPDPVVNDKREIVGWPIKTQERGGYRD